MPDFGNLVLPAHETRRYDPVGQCIYCRSLDALTDEHIIPFSMGGRWILPAASCKKCATNTGKFEGEVSRTIIGPLRMLYNLPTRRKKERPQSLPLKVKYKKGSDWETLNVDRSICPFLVGLPLYPLPDAVTGIVSEVNRGPATSQLWIRGASFWRNRDQHLQWLCDTLGVVEVMPEATVHTEPFCLLLAKVAHSYAVAELGLDGFSPFLNDIILTRDLSNRAHVIGGGKGNENASVNLHDLSFDSEIGFCHDVIVVRVRLLASLETPTYFIAAGLRQRDHRNGG